jgi:hypothetical protein
VADANQVMADFNTIVTGCNTNAAHLGSNTDITSLAGLTTPLSTAQGGTGISAPGAAGNMLTVSAGGVWQSAAPGIGLQPDPNGSGAVGLSILVPPQGRLSLVSGQNAPISDVTSAAAIYYVPRTGNIYPLWDGTRWQLRKFDTQAGNQLTLTLDGNSGHFLYHQPNSNFDLFLYSTGGVDYLVSGTPWTNATTRATSIVVFNGILVNSGAMSVKYDNSTNTFSVPNQQATYVGTFRTLGAAVTAMIMNPAGASGGAATQLLLWNNYNRILTRGLNIDNGAAYAYSGALRWARNSNTNTAIWVTGYAEDAIMIKVSQFVNFPATASLSAQLGIGLDGAIVSWDNAAAFAQMQSAVANSAAYNLTHYLPPQIGYHSAIRLEAAANGSVNFDYLSYDHIQVALPM